MHLAAQLTRVVAKSCPSGTVDCTGAQGPGTFLHVFVVVAVVLLVLGAWFILRGYGQNNKK